MVLAERCVISPKFTKQVYNIYKAGLQSTPVSSVGDRPTEDTGVRA